MKDVDYKSGDVPRRYKCSVCGVRGVKLWRETAHFPPFALECVRCAVKSQREPGASSIARTPIRVTHEGRVHGAYEHGGASDQIGWRVPAVPDEEGVGYWGYSSVPRAGVDWWKRLPLVHVDGARVLEVEL